MTFPRSWLSSALVVPKEGSESVMRTPDPRFPDITLPAPVAVPPMMLLAALTTMPSLRLGIVAVPEAARPTRLPCTTLPDVPAPWISMPACALPETRLAADPSMFAAPMELPDAPEKISTPRTALGTLPVPARFVPIQFPSARFWFDALRSNPVPALPEIRLPEKLLSEPSEFRTFVPPIVLSVVPLMRMPSPALGTAREPSALVPIRLPAIAFPRFAVPPVTPESFPSRSIPL